MHPFTVITVVSIKERETCPVFSTPRKVGTYSVTVVLGSARSNIAICTKMIYSEVRAVLETNKSQHLNLLELTLQVLYGHFLMQTTCDKSIDPWAINAFSKKHNSTFHSQLTQFSSSRLTIFGSHSDALPWQSFSAGMSIPFSTKSSGFWCGKWQSIICRWVDRCRGKLSWRTGRAGNCGQTLCVEALLMGTERKVYYR